MTRICACGATIVPAWLDGHTVWLDEQPGHGGMFTVRPDEGDLIAEVRITGRYRRHLCEQSRPVAVVIAPVERPRRPNVALTRASAGRDIPVLQALLASGRPISSRGRSVAVARIEHPLATHVQLAEIVGISRPAYTRALHRVLRYDNVQHLVTTGARP